jgi:hypothetical protein
MTFPAQIATRVGFRLPAFLARTLVLFCLMAASSALAATNAVEKLANVDCLDCHIDPTNSRKVEG